MTMISPEYRVSLHMGKPEYKNTGTARTEVSYAGYARMPVRDPFDFTVNFPVYSGRRCLLVSHYGVWKLVHGRTWRLVVVGQFTSGVCHLQRGDSIHVTGRYVESA